MAAPTKTMTLAEYLALPETNLRMEFWNGEVYQEANEMPAPRPAHQRLIRQLYDALRSLAVEGEWWLAPTDVMIDAQHVVQPDLFWIAPDSACVLVEDRYWQGAPDLVIEVISEATARRDRQTKYELYQRAGVREYWIVDPRDGSVEVFQRTGEGFRRVGIFYADDTLTSPLLNASLPLQGVLGGA
ncbi:MAG: Uma2 family endonuclease [Anaerolinea sp.]